jgi:single-strand selective monofunctional uracil DNA glycosylase
MTSSLNGIINTLSHNCEKINFSGQGLVVYNPLNYAKLATAQYLDTYGQGRKEVLFLSLNPGPFGMAQTGIPFGDVYWVTKYLKIHNTIEQPKDAVHPKRPILGFDCTRKDVSADRFWKLISSFYPNATTFFQKNFLWTFAPLYFCDKSGKNITPDKINLVSRKELEQICLEALKNIILSLQVNNVISIGAYVYKNVLKLDAEVLNKIEVENIPHPSPLNPANNKGWDIRVKDMLSKYFK